MSAPLLLAAAARAGLVVGVWQTGCVVLAETGETWDPLANTAQAIDLALRMRVHVMPSDKLVRASVRGQAHSVAEFYADHKGDEAKAMRFAIVRAVVV